MTIFFNYLKRLLKNKIQIMFILILPLLIIPVVFDAPATEKAITVGVEDEDRTKLTSALLQELGNHCTLVEMEMSTVEDDIIHAKISYAIHIGKGYTESLIRTGKSSMEGYANKERDVSLLVGAYIDSFINPIKGIASASGGDETSFYEGLDYYLARELSVVYEKADVPDHTRAKAAWNLIIQFMMFSSIFATTILIADKDNRTLFRTLSAPVYIRSYMFQAALCFFTIAILQIIVMIGITAGIFGIYPGRSGVNTFLLLAVFSLVCIAIGIAVSSFCKTVVQAVLVGISMTLLFGIAGGTWGEITYTGFMKNIVRFDPVIWAVEGVSKLLDQGILVDIMRNMGVLFLFAVVFFLFGTWKKADITKH